MPNLKYALASLITALLSMTCFFADAAAMSISGTPPATATVGQQYSFRAVIENANTSKLMFSYANRPAWAPPHYSKCGCIIGIPTAPGVFANIQIRVWDGQHFAQTRPFTITVQGTKAVTPAPLKISGAPSSTAVVGKFYSFAPTVVAPSGSALTYAIANRPSWTQFSAATGNLSGVPTASSVGTASGITIKVSDGAESATLPQFNIAVAPAAAPAAGSATLSWAKPTQNTDGSPLTDLAGYVVRYGTSTAALNSQISVGSPNSTDAEISNLTAGNWYFEVASINTADVESQFSAPISKTIP
jgi:phage gpG-like protein